MWHWHRSHPSDHDVRASNAAAAILTRDALLLVSSGMLVWNSWRCISRTHRARLDAKPPPRLNEPLQTWEDEGGRPDPVGAPSDTPARPASTV